MTAVKRTKRLGHCYKCKVKFAANRPWLPLPVDGKVRQVCLGCAYKSATYRLKGITVHSKRQPEARMTLWGCGKLRVDSYIKRGAFYGVPISWLVEIQ